MKNKIILVARIIKNIFYKIFFRKDRFRRYNSIEFSWINYSHSSPESRFPIEKQYAIDYAIRNIKTDSPVLEIGVCSGRSTTFTGCLLNKYSKENKLITTDPWWNCPDQYLSGPNEPIAPQGYRDYIKSQYITNAKFWFGEKLPTSFDLDSDTFFEKWNTGKVSDDVFGREFKMGGEISFCYLDGDHSFHQVKKDFENIDKVLEKNGFIFFDDSDRLHLDHGEVKNGCYEVVQLALKSKKYKCVLRNPNYLLQKI